MKNFIITSILCISAMFTLNSCATEAFAQTTVIETIDTPSFNIILEYGTPYIYGGYTYYLYRNNFYYRHYSPNGNIIVRKTRPYYYNNVPYPYVRRDVRINHGSHMQRDTTRPHFQNKPNHNRPINQPNTQRKLGGKR